MHDAVIIEGIRTKFHALTVIMDERMRRQWAATEAMQLGWGGIRQVANATGISRTTILAGVRELKAREATDPCPVQAFVAWAVVANRWSKPIRVFGTHWMPWSIPLLAAIRRLHYGGLAKAPGNWPRS